MWSLISVRVCGYRLKSIHAEADLIFGLGVCLLRMKERGEAGEELRAWAKGLEGGADALSFLIEGGVGEDAGDIADRAVSEGMVQEAMDAVPQREGALQDGGGEDPTIACARGNCQDFIGSLGGRDRV